MHTTQSAIQSRREVPPHRGRRSLLGAILLIGFCVAPSATLAKDVDLTFTTPTNDPSASTVTVKIGATTLSIQINAGTSAGQKRDLIFDKIDANAVPNFDVVKKGATGLTIQNLTAGTVVQFDPGKTGEAADKITAQLPHSGTIDLVSTTYDPLDVFGNPSAFTGGVVTDAGELAITLLATDLAALDGAAIAAALFGALEPQESLFGFDVVNFGTSLAFSFDPAFTTTIGGVIFGTTALNEGVSGTLLAEVPEPAALPLLAAGAALLAAMRRRRVG